MVLDTLLRNTAVLITKTLDNRLDQPWHSSELFSMNILIMIRDASKLGEKKVHRRVN